MSDMTTSALPGAQFAGFVTVREAGMQGMVALRGDIGSDLISQAVLQATGCALPDQRKVTRNGDHAVAWMSPDEVLILCPHAKAAPLVTTLSQALAGEFVTLADVSDARAVFTLSGPLWRDALAKLCPVEFGALAEGDLRRTRAAQVPAAIWVSAPDTAMLICFRSVAGYMFDLLRTAAAPGSEPGLHG